MRFAREKRRLLGWLAMLAPLPLPLNEPRPMGVVSWAVIVLWVALMGVFLRRTARGDERWLKTRSLNVLGVAYLPLLALDLALFGADLLIRPMMHLALFALAAKLFSMHRERDKWHALLGIFFVFVTSAATSTSVGILAYLAVFMIGAVYVLSRFATLHVESFENDGDASSLPNVRRSGRWLIPATFLLMVPLFGIFPRFTNPFLFGSGDGSVRIGTGFSDEVRLDGIGRIRSSQEVAMRIGFRGREPARRALAGLRLRGATYDVYRGDSWEQSPQERRLRVGDDGVLVVGDGPVVSEALVWLEPLEARAIILPERTVRVRSDFRGGIEIGEGGALSFLVPPRSTVQYEVFLASSPPQWASPPGFDGEGALDLSGVTPRIAELAVEVAGEGDPDEKAMRIENHLQTEYDYQLELLDPQGEDVIERFLFDRRAGHCEYFASAMVLMLRSQGIPARFVTGFLGAEPSRLGYSIVRQSNAHAWVEAYLPERGWTVFDPTPPAGRPLAASGSVLAFFGQAYDWMIFSWDRYVVGFGSGEQRMLWSRLMSWIRDLLQGRPEEQVSRETPPTSVEVGTEELPAEPPPDGGDRRLWLLAVAGALALLALWIRRRMDPQTAYLEVRRAARRRGLEGPVGPLAFADQCVAAFPSAAEPVRRVVDVYVRDSFAAGPAADSSTEDLRRQLVEARRGFREDWRAQRRRKKAGGE